MTDQTNTDSITTAPPAPVMVLKSDHSVEAGEIFGALATAQLAISGAVKGAENDFFKSRYADLAAVWEACHEALNAQGIAITQLPSSDDKGVVVTTILGHKSGQWIRSTLRMQPKDRGPQAFGSCITYARRYALSAMTGVAQMDDDGNAATGRNGTQSLTRKEKMFNTLLEWIGTDDQASIQRTMVNADVLQVGEPMRKLDNDEVGHLADFVAQYADRDWVEVMTFCESRRNGDTE